MAYFANGTEGIILHNQCDKCPLGSGPCAVAAAQTFYNYDQIDNDTATAILETLVSKDGICQMRPEIIEATGRQFGVEARNVLQGIGSGGRG